MSEPTEGEQLFAEYLVHQGMVAEREYIWPHTLKRPDYRLEHPLAGSIVIEIKDICTLPPTGSGSYDPYGEIRAHIQAARKQFKPFSNFCCVLALRAMYPSPLADLSDPIAMLGAMYGNYGVTIPFDPELGRLDRSKMGHEFLPGQGKMLQLTPTKEKRPQNTRISAIVTVHNYDVQAMRFSRHAKTSQGYGDRMSGTVTFPVENIPGVTVWENGFAERRLPRDLFRGDMDQWWSTEENGQTLTYVGERLKSLGD